MFTSGIAVPRLPTAYNFLLDEFKNSRLGHVTGCGGKIAEFLQTLQDIGETLKTYRPAGPLIFLGCNLPPKGIGPLEYKDEDTTKGGCKFLLCNKQARLADFPRANATLPTCSGIYKSQHSTGSTCLQAPDLTHAPDDLNEVGLFRNWWKNGLKQVVYQTSGAEADVKKLMWLVADHGMSNYMHYVLRCVGMNLSPTKLSPLTLPGGELSWAVPPMPAVNKQHEFLNAAKHRDWVAVRLALALTPALINTQPSGRWPVLHQAAEAGEVCPSVSSIAPWGWPHLWAL